MKDKNGNDLRIGDQVFATIRGSHSRFKIVSIRPKVKVVVLQPGNYFVRPERVEKQISLDSVSNYNWE